MSSEKQDRVEVKAAASSIFDMAGGEDVTTQQLIDKHNTSDENLALKTELNNPLVVAAWDTVADIARQRGYNRTAHTMSHFSKLFKEDMVSFERKGRTEFKEMVIADLQRSRDANESELQQLGIKRGR